MLRFLIRSSTGANLDQASPEIRGPCTFAEVADLVRTGAVGPHTELGDATTGRWAPAAEWDLLRPMFANLGRIAAAHPPAAVPSPPVAPHRVSSAPEAAWPSRPASEVADPETLETGVEPFPVEEPIRRVTCAVCRETITASAVVCPECGELAGAGEAFGPSSAGAPSSAYPLVPETTARGWLALHWRPTVTMTVIGSVLVTGIALRHLAPDRYTPPRHLQPPPAAAVCDTPCWHGETCRVGRCEWLAPNDVGHVPPEHLIAGPFQLPHDAVDVLPLDADRFAVSCMRGVEIYASRSGEVLSLVSDAPQAQGLYRVGSVLYATSPHRIHVIDVESTRVLKSIEIGSPVFDLHVGAGGQRVVASVPGALSVVVIATDHHAEISRFFFGDDAVGPVTIDDTGSRGLATTGRSPLLGQRGMQGGALYAFDPSRLASQQDRVRAAMAGNPVQVTMAPDGETSFVLLRELDGIVPLKRLASGAVLRGEPIATCRKPEQLEMIPLGRRAIVRCSDGKALEVFDLEQRKLLRHIPLQAGASDVVVSPDGQQAIIALPYDRAGAVGMLDLQSYELALTKLGAEPRRVRITPDGTASVVVSDVSKVAWVLR